ncbi:hypothetical protein ACSLVK_07185 [Photorhabdus tasmaniensis]|nr:hypothetical protein [Photorhabdus tasmaniensis]
MSVKNIMQSESIHQVNPYQDAFKIRELALLLSPTRETRLTWVK